MVRIAGVQFIGQAGKEANIATAIRLVRQAAAQGARIVCLPELFSTMYFCVETRREYFEWAEPIPGPTIERMGAVARETGIVLIAPDLRARRRTDVLQHRSGARARRRAHRQVSEVEHPLHGRAVAATSRAATRSSTSSPAISAFPTFDTPFGRIGILICYDRHFTGGRARAGARRRGNRLRRPPRPRS